MTVRGPVRRSTSTRARAYWRVPPRLRNLAVWRTVAEWCAAAFAIGLVAIRRWNQMGPDAPGIDQGHWLAFGHAYLGRGNPSLSHLYPITVMPPLVPLAMSTLTDILNPDLASRWLAVLSIVAVMAAGFGVVRRTAGPWAAIVLGIVLGASATVIEPSAWGGYPQNFALAGMIVVVFSGSDYLHTRSRTTLAVYLVSLLAVSLTHHAYFGVTAAAMIALVLLWLTSRPGWRHAGKTLIALVAGSLPALVVFAVVAGSLWSARYDPAVDASGSSLRGALAYGFPTTRAIWALLGVVGLAGLGLSFRMRSRPVERRTALALVAVSAVTFPLTGEARLLPPLVVGLMIGISLMVDVFSDHGARLLATGLAIGALLVALGILWPPSDRKADIAFSYYAVLNRSTVQTARFLDAAPGYGAAAVRTDARGWPVGWWLRGLTQRPLLVGSDAKWLGFPSERAEASTVQHLFDGELTADAAAALARASGVRFLVFNERDWLSWKGWDVNGSGPWIRVYDDGEHIVLAINGGS